MVIDRSASMDAVKEVAQPAINGFIEEQKKVDGDCTFRLIDFNAPGSFAGHGSVRDWYHLKYEGSLHNFKRYKLEPHGNTALLDAVGMEIMLTGRYLESMPEDQRPDKVVFVVESDGQENSSSEYGWAQVQAMIEEQTEKYNWQFVFLGMGPDSWGQGERIGTRSVIASARSDVAYGHTHSVTNAVVADYRAGGQSVNAAMRNLTVDEAGEVVDEEGNILDPTTAKVTGKKKK
jgi:hypothetical protein